MKAVYTQPSFLPDADALNVWYTLLKDLEYRVVNTAIQKYMLTQKHPPVIADIREMCANVVCGDKPLWSDGWEEVVMAIRRYGSYNEEKAMEKMSDITKQCVRRLGYQNLCRSEDISIERANFRMIYEQIANREEEKRKLPPQMLKWLEQQKQNLLEG